MSGHALTNPAPSPPRPSRRRPHRCLTLGAAALMMLVPQWACAAEIKTEPAPAQPASPQQPGPAFPSVVTGTPAPFAFASLPWPARRPLAPGMTEAELGLGRPEGAPQGWCPQGTIIPMSAPVVFTRVAKTPSAKQAERMAADQARLDIVLRERLVGLDAHAQTRMIVHDGPGQFIAREAVLDEPRDAPSPRAGRANLLFQFVSLREMPREARLVRSEPGPDGKRELNLELEDGPTRAQVNRTSFAFYDAASGWDDTGKPLDAIPPRGVVLVMPGMLGTPGEVVQDTVKLLRTRGYAVLRMLAHPARFTQTGQIAVPTTGPLDPAAKAIADELTGRAAEAAYAVEAALAYVHSQRDGLKGLPHFALGMSGGAMILPTVMARDPQRWTGAVSIGGGVNYLEILSTSNYTNMIQSLDVLWFDPPTNEGGTGGQFGRLGAAPSPERQRELWDAYLKLAPLDPQNLAPALASKHWLLIQGKTDKAVPAITGERMWELLNRPERQVVDGGHEWLFLTITRRLSSIASWLDKHTTAPASPVVPPPAPSSPPATGAP